MIFVTVLSPFQNPHQSFIHTTSSDPGTCASRAGNISICKSEVEASISINASEAPKCNASAICFAMPVRECLIFSFWPARIFAKTSWDLGECARKVPFFVVLLSVDTAWNPAIQQLINVTTHRPCPPKHGVASAMCARDTNITAAWHRPCVDKQRACSPTPTMA